VGPRRFVGEMLDDFKRSTLRGEDTMDSERLANRHCYPCANRVTWTRQHTMILGGEKTLILLTFHRQPPKEANLRKFPREKAR
jgi:hypothetical protein